MELRTRKQVTVAAVYSLILAIFAGLLYFFFFYQAPVCTDGIQNGREEGVDCGGVCANACIEKVAGAPFTIEEVAIMPGGTDKYDVLGRVYNPNDTEGASSFEYTLTLKDASGQELVTKKGTSYILPQEHKTLIEVGLESLAVPATATLSIGSITWERFSGYQEKPNINIYQKRYNQIAGGVGFGEAFGLVSNESPFDFRSLIVKVILRDREGKPLAVNSTEMRTVTSGEERDFRLLWPEQFPGTVEAVDMEVDADYYHADNFMKQYLKGGRFQDVSQGEN
ncbi:MAG: hypothetical protein KIH67_003040 [Candidatus Moranbacteria bacterium]|nr:hypothetical protein [Candidatus Moranbacteria bacterium]